MDEDLGQLHALRAIASHINAGNDVSETLRLTLEAFCRETRWIGAVIMQADRREGIVRVLARHDPTGLRPPLRESQWPLAESPVQRVLQTGAPVVLHDAQAARHYPGYRRESRAQGFRTVVILPMASGSFDGDGLVLAASSREVEAVTQRDIAFLELVVHLGSIAAQRARSLRQEQVFAARLTATMRANAALLDRVLSDGSATDLVASVAEDITAPLVVIDLTSRRISLNRSPWPDHVDEVGWTTALEGELRSEFLALARSCGASTMSEERDVVVRFGARTLRRMATVCPLRVDGTLVGALLVFAEPGEDRTFVDLLIEGARLSLSLQMMRAHAKSTAEARGRETFLAGLLNGTMPGIELNERAQHLGIALDRSARLLVIGFADPAAVTNPIALEALRSVSDVARRNDRCSATALGELIVLHRVVSPKEEARWTALVGQTLDEVRSATGQGVLAVCSKTCTATADYPIAFRECARIIELGQRLGRTGELNAQDFGPVPVLMSAIDPGIVGDFVQHLVGGVARHDQLRGTAYLATLSSYLDHGCRAQACAAALGLHVTTLRYRLSRLRELFGLTSETPDERFAIQLAIRCQLVLPLSNRAERPMENRRTSTAQNGERPFGGDQRSWPRSCFARTTLVH